MKTTHQIARELLALPDIPCFHLDPSRAGTDEDGASGMSSPTVEENRVTDANDDDYHFATISGEMDEGGEAVGAISGLGSVIADEEETHEQKRGESGRSNDWEDGFISGLKYVRENLLPAAAKT